MIQGVGHVCSVCDEVILDNACIMDGVVMCEKDYQVKTKRSIYLAHKLCIRIW